MAFAPLIISAATSLVQFEQRRSAAKIQEGEAEVSAKSEEVAAIQREADRKGRLASAMASQTASAGARGISVFEGSPLAILEEDIRREEVATQRDIFQSRLGALTTRARGKIRSSQIKTGAAIGLLSDFRQAAASAPVSKGKT